MGLQKYRADECGPDLANGGIPYYTKWMGGSTLALIRNCKIENIDLSPRTVYVRGGADSYYSIPAACKYRQRVISGYITSDDNGEYVFCADNKGKMIYGQSTN